MKPTRRFVQAMAFALTSFVVDAAETDTTASCGAEKSVCDQLVRDFVELNNRVSEQVQRR